ncbi:MAG TPA: hypothetical protein VMB79_05665 [Jatrophihabitans sp.]|nr:hypothetical protein [Jatrophihabitans sp.]
MSGALVLLAGCGSSGHHPSAAGSSSPGGSLAAPSPTASAATVAQLKKIVLQAADLPTGWKGTPAQADSSASDEASLLSCIGTGRKNTDPDQVATADSQDFTLGAATISSSATSYRAQSDVDSDKALLSNPKLPSCYSDLLKKQLAAAAPGGAAVGNVSVKFTPGPGTGPANVAGSGAVTVQLTANGRPVPLYIDFAYLTGRQLEAEVDAESAGTPVPASVLQAAIKAVAGRLDG